MFEELETVVLNQDIKEHTLEKGDIGTIVSVYKGGKAFEVEFVNAEGKTVALLTLTSANLRSLASSDMFHVRGGATASSSSPLSSTRSLDSRYQRSRES